MIRTLAMIAVAGFVLCLASFAAAVAVGGPTAIADYAWNRRWGWGLHDVTIDDHHQHDGPQVTRELTWNGRDRLDIDVDAEVTFTQAPGPAKLIVTGPQRLVDDLEVEDGRIDYARRRHHGSAGPLSITLSAPDITRFALNGSGSLAIQDYRQDHLDVDLSGSGNVRARGQARDVTLDISGSGNADLAQLAAEGASVEISGSGEASVAPTKRAKLDISGSGEVILLSHPDQLETDVSGSGHVRQDAPAAPAPPTPPAKPS